MNDTASYPHRLRLATYPDPVLRRRAAEVEAFDDELRRFCQAMLDAMEEHRGVGLAAPQVGVLRRIFVTNHVGTDPDVLPDRRVWINPRIERAEGRHRQEEGCLSIPGIYAEVERPAAVEVAYRDEHGREHRLHLDAERGDFLAVVVQHELDHLDGRLFLDHLAPEQLAPLRRPLRDLEKAYRLATGRAGEVLRR